MSGLPYRVRPDWQVLVYQQALGVVAGLKLLDSLEHARWLQYSGDIFPWGRSGVLAGVELGASVYWVLFSCQVLALVAYFLRVKPRWAAAALGLLFLFDTQVGFENHRLLLSFLLLLVSLAPVPRGAAEEGYRGHRIYFNQELAAYQVAIVYVCTVAHKVNAAFVSGDVIRNLLWYVHEQGWRAYSESLYELLQDPAVCRALALATLVLELGVAVGLLFRRTVGYCIPLAVGMHLTFSILMPWIGVFTAMMLVVQVAFLPTRIEPGTYLLLRGTAQRGPTTFLRLVWRGLLETQDGDEAAWTLQAPSGRRLSGYAAWVELLSLSPLTFVAAEVMGTAPLRALGRRVLRA